MRRRACIVPNFGIMVIEYRWGGEERAIYTQEYFKILEDVYDTKRRIMYTDVCWMHKQTGSGKEVGRSI